MGTNIELPQIDKHSHFHFHINPRKAPQKADQPLTLVMQGIGAVHRVTMPFSQYIVLHYIDNLPWWHKISNTNKHKPVFLFSHNTWAYYIIKQLHLKAKIKTFQLKNLQRCRQYILYLCTAIPHCQNFKKVFSNSNLQFEATPHKRGRFLEILWLSSADYYILLHGRFKPLFLVHLERCQPVLYL